MSSLVTIPIIGAALEATGMTIEKKIMQKHKINAKNLTVYGFLALVLVMLPLMYFFWDMKPQATSPTNLLIFIVVIIASIGANLLVFYALKRETLSEIEPIRLMQPLFTVVLAFIFSYFFTSYSSDKNIMILGLALIASITLIVSHIEKHHLKFDKYIIAALIGSFLFAVELVISRSILDYYSPLTFYFLRGLTIFIITYLIFHPHISNIKGKTQIMILVSGVVWVVYRVLLYTSYTTNGVVLTTMLFILAPIFVYTFAHVFLKEKIKLKQIISSIIIVACVVAAMIISN